MSRNTQKWREETRHIFSNTSGAGKIKKIKKKDKPPVGAHAMMTRPVTQRWTCRGFTDGGWIDLKLSVKLCKKAIFCCGTVHLFETG